MPLPNLGGMKGRADTITGPKWEEYLSHIRNGKGRVESARLVGAAYSTVSRRMRMDPTLREQVMEAEEEAAEPVEQVLYEAAIRGEPWAVKMWLTHRAKGRWQDERALSVNVSGTVGVGVEVEAGPAMQRIAALQARLIERAGGEILDVVSTEAEPLSLPPLRRTGAAQDG